MVDIKYSLLGLMSLIFVGCTASNPTPTDFPDQIAYVGSVKSFTLAQDAPSLSNSCGTLEIEFSVVASTIPIGTVQIEKETMDEWCRTRIEWDPTFEWLVIKNTNSENMLHILPVYRGTAIVEFDFENEPSISAEIRELFKITKLSNPFPYIPTFGNRIPHEGIVNSDAIEVRNDLHFVIKGIEIYDVFAVD